MGQHKYKRLQLTDICLWEVCFQLQQFLCQRSILPSEKKILYIVIHALLNILMALLLPDIKQGGIYQF